MHLDSASISGPTTARRRAATRDIECQFERTAQQLALATVARVAASRPLASVEVDPRSKQISAMSELFLAAVSKAGGTHSAMDANVDKDGRAKAALTFGGVYALDQFARCTTPAPAAEREHVQSRRHDIFAE